MKILNNYTKPISLTIVCFRKKTRLCAMSYTCEKKIIMFFVPHVISSVLHAGVGSLDQEKFNIRVAFW